MAVSFISHQVGNSSTSTTTALFPSGGVLTDDLLILHIACKTTAATFTITDDNAGDGIDLETWTFLGEAIQPSGTTGVADEGPIKVMVWYQIRQTAIAAGAVSIRLTANAATAGFTSAILQYRKSSSTTVYDIKTVYEAMASPTTATQTVVGNFGSEILASGDEMAYIMGFNSDTYSFSTYATTLPSTITRGTITERRDVAYTGGTQIRAVTATFSLTGGSNSGSFTLTTIASGFVSGVNPWGAAVVMRIRDVAAPNTLKTNFFSLF